jgi:hypothetical protein
VKEGPQSRDDGVEKEMVLFREGEQKCSWRPSKPLFKAGGLHQMGLVEMELDPFQSQPGNILREPHVLPRQTSTRPRGTTTVLDCLSPETLFTFSSVSLALSAIRISPVSVSFPHFAQSPSLHFTSLENISPSAHEIALLQLPIKS